MGLALVLAGVSLVSFGVGVALERRRTRLQVEAARQCVLEAEEARDIAEERVESLMEERVELFRENGRLRVERQRLAVN